jgi:predicted metal-binding membrane protein
VAGFLLWKRKEERGGENIVKRILTVLVVALVMAAMMVATAAPAFAAVKKVGPDKQFHLQQNGPHSPPFNGGDKHSPPPND